MCGRFSLTYQERQRLADELGVSVEDIPVERYRPRFNVAPTDEHWILRLQHEDRELLPAKWGLVNSWAKDARQAARQINARAETVATAAAFRDAFHSRRCVVPADGFYEWRQSGGARQPFWLHRGEGGLLLFAGLYESWQPQPGHWQRTFTIITTDANQTVSSIHDRMPVILHPDAVDEWLFREEKDVEKLQRLLKPAPDELLAATAVSQRVNSVRNDDPACLDPAEPSQASLL